MLRKPRAVFLLKSPLQYLNALEAISSFELNSDETLWLFLSDSKSRHQLSALAELDQDDGKVAVFLADLPLIPRIDDLSGPAKSGSNKFFANALFSIIKLNRLAKECPDIPLVFVGDLANPLMRHFVNRVQPQRTVHLDDGVATLDYASRRTAGEKVRTPGWSKRIKLVLKRKILGLRDETLPALTFFTLYRNLEVGPKDLIVAHDFSSLRRQLVAIPRVEKIYFLGGPLVEAEFFDQSAYLGLLQRVAAHYADKQVVYIAHRRENQQRLELIRQQTGWQTQLFEYPIEYQLARVGPRPCQLASFFSSGLETCQQIFGSELEIRSFALPPEVLARLPAAKRQPLERLYLRLKTMMPVIDLPEQS